MAWLDRIAGCLAGRAASARALGEPACFRNFGSLVAPRADRASALYGEQPHARACRRGGRGAAWHRLRLGDSGLRFPRPGLAAVGSRAAARHAGVRRCVRVHRLPPIQRAGAERSARMDRMACARILVSRDPLAARRRGPVRAGAVPLRVPPGAGGLPRALAESARRGAGERPAAGCGVSARGAAARASCAGGGRRAGGDGDTSGLRCGVLLRPRDAHHGHLQGVVRPRGPQRGGAAVAAAARPGRAGAVGRAPLARPRALSGQRQPARTAGAPARRRGLGAHAVVLTARAARFPAAGRDPGAAGGAGRGNGQPRALCCQHDEQLHCSRARR